MKAACILLTALVLFAVMAICVMVKFATEISVDERNRDDLPDQFFKFSKSMGMVPLVDKADIDVSERFPYIAAITRNTSKSWAFACFGSMILVKWVITAAQCRTPGSTHRVLLYHDFVKNFTHTYPILFWRLHEKYNATSDPTLYNIAVAKLNVDLFPYTLKSSVFSEQIATDVEASVWKTVSTMDKKIFLTNDMEKFDVKIAPDSKCRESYGVQVDESIICVDTSDYEDCFVHDFGPVYSADRLIGLLVMKPRDCDMKLSVFTNVSFYTSWILKTTRTTRYG